MNAHVDPRLTVGGNNPPTTTEFLAEKYGALKHEAETLRADLAEAPATIRNDDELGAVTATIKRADSMLKRAESMRVAEKEPYLQGGREVDAFFKSLGEDVTKALRAVRETVTAYARAKEAEVRRQREEEARRAREEEQRRLAEAAAAESAARPAEAALAFDETARVAAEADRLEQRAAAPAADLARTHTAAGTVSLRTSWDFEITDREALRATLGPLGHHFTLPAVEQAIRAFIKAGNRELPGVRIFQTSSALVR